ncbi:MAG TPA: YfaZ family outer membrane protein [Gallionellaceae bacterium]
MKLMRVPFITGFVAAFSMLTAGTAMADMLDINLNNNTAQFQYSTASGPNDQGRANLHAGFLYNNANSVLGNAGIMVTNGLEAAPGFSVGVGMEGVVAVIKDVPPTRYTASAIALDALLRFSPSTARNVAFVGELHYAPKILAFGDAQRFSQGVIRVEYELAPSTTVYLGVRQTSFGLKNTRAADLDRGVHVGFKMAF